MSDRALWITWYDLPEEGRESWLKWAHSEYLPALAERPGYLHVTHYASVPRGEMSRTRKEGALHNTEDASVPTGDRFIIIVGAEHANVFGDPVPSALHLGLPGRVRERLSKRSGVRENVMVEAARAVGPASKTYPDGMKLSPCIQMGSFNCAWQHEEEVHAWYTQWRMRAMETLPGTIRTRRLASVSGWAKHAILYEFTSREMRDRHFAHHEDDRPDMKAWSDKVVPYLEHAPGSANLATRIWPG